MEFDDIEPTDSILSDDGFYFYDTPYQQRIRNKDDFYFKDVVFPLNLENSY